MILGRSVIMAINRSIPASASSGAASINPVEGIINGVTAVKEKISAAGEKIMNAFKDFFSINPVIIPSMICGSAFTIAIIISGSAPIIPIFSVFTVRRRK